MLSGYASISHSHAISDITNLSSAMSGITESEITKTSAIFQDLVVTGLLSIDQLDFQSLNASSIVVDGVSVALEGHSHSMMDIVGLDAVSASISSMGEQLDGVTQHGINKSTATFGDVSASTMTLEGESVATQSWVNAMT